MNERNTLFVFVAVFVLFLAGLAIVLPHNPFTGKVVADVTCGSLGCTELCDINSTCAQKGTVCCATHWDTGVCDYAVNCEKIKEYSLYQSVETYQESVRDKPALIQADPRRFFFPLVLILGIICYFIWKRNSIKH